MDGSIAMTSPVLPLIIDHVSSALSPISASDAVTFRNREPTGRLSDTVTVKVLSLKTGVLSLISRMVTLTETVSDRGGEPLSEAWITSV